MATGNLPTYLYHYTTKAALGSIKKHKRINKSEDSNRDARYGPGVYFTAKPPQSSTKTLLENNYGTNTQAKANRVSAYIRMKTASCDKIVYDNTSDGRDVYKVVGDLDLNTVEWKAGIRKEFQNYPKQRAGTSAHRGMFW